MYPQPIVPYFGGNRGIGFNRATWRTGNAIGRAARPYVNSAVSRVRQWMNRNNNKRQAKKADRRKAKSAGTSAVGQQIPSGGGETKSFFTLVKPQFVVRNKDLKMLAPSSTIRNNKFTSTSGIGQQNAVLIGSYFDVTDVSNTFATLQQTLTGQHSSKALFQKLHSTSMITNSCNLNTHMTIYDVLARQDGSATNVDPVTVFLAGGVDALGGAASDALIPGYSPFNNPRFTEVYKVLKRTPVVLCPGQTHVHTVDYQPNKLFSNERVTTSNGVGPLGQFSLYTFLIYHGTPVHDKATELVITVGQVKLDIVSMENLIVKAAYLNYALNSAVNALAVTMTDPEQWVENSPTDTINAI